MSGVYTFLAADLLTNKIIEELPLSGVRFSRIISGSGDFSASLKLGDARVRKLDWLTSTEPRRTMLYIDRDGTLLFGGVVWTRRYSSTDGTLQISGNDVWSIFRRRLLRIDKTYAAVDQLAIARDLIAYSQGKPGGSVGLQVGAGLSGVLRDRTYLGTDEKPIAEAVEELSAVEGGFEFYSTVGYDSSGQPAKYLRLGYPTVGRASVDSALVFELGANLVSYDWSEDGASSANLVDAIGAVPEGGEKPIRAAGDAPADRAGGYPLLETSSSYTDVSVQGTLQAHANADVADRAKTSTLPSAVVTPTGDPEVGTYDLGDEARLRIEDPRFPDGVDIVQRITRIDVAAGDTATAESVTLSFDDPQVGA